jgi:uncharacterized phage-associated protein
MLNKPNIAKIKEAVLFLLNNASDDLDQYKIAKAIFWADVNHLNKFGRPVTYDNYVAMKFGPVPSKTYEFLSRDPEPEIFLYTCRSGRTMSWSCQEAMSLSYPRHWAKFNHHPSTKR